MTEVGNYAFCTSNNEYTSLQLPASDVTVTVTFCLRAYNIDIAQNIQNGTVSASVNNEPATTAKMGDLVTLTVVPDTGWSLDTLAVTDAHNQAVALTAGGGNTWTFPIPADRVTVTAAFAAVDYPIVIADITNGSVAASVNNAPAAAAHYGDLVTLTVTPDSSCRLEFLAVTDANGSAVALTANGTDAWTFTMPAGQVTVTAAFVKLYPVVIAENIPNGTLTASVTEAAEREVVTLTAAPDQGFVLVENGLIVVSESMFSFEIVPVTNNQFTMPANNVVVAAAFLPAAKPVSYIDEAGEERTAMAYDPTHQNKGGFDRPGIVQGPNKYT